MELKLCCWNKGSICIYTRKIDVVKQAIKDGFYVSEIKEKAHIYNGELFQ